jgi:hypothetical protein
MIRQTSVPGHVPYSSTTLSQSGSVMDYNPVAVALPGETQGDFVPTRLGPYDFWAIEYAYKPLPPGKEDEALKAIATRAGDPLLGYATDEDALGTYSAFAMDPYVNQFDASGDPLGFERRRVTLVRELWSKAKTKLVEPGEGFQVLRRVVGRGFVGLGRSAAIAAKFVGGVETSRARAGDAGGRAPLQPVPAAKQREALEFLAKEVFSDEGYRLPPTLFAKLAPERMYGLAGLGSFFGHAGRLDHPWHDQVLGVQQRALNRALDTVVLARVQDNEVQSRAAGQEPFTMAELFAGLDAAIWGGAGERESKHLQHPPQPSARSSPAALALCPATEWRPIRPGGCLDARPGEPGGPRAKGSGCQPGGGNYACPPSGCRKPR